MQNNKFNNNKKGEKSPSHFKYWTTHANEHFSLLAGLKEPLSLTEKAKKLHSPSNHTDPEGSLGWLFVTIQMVGHSEKFSCVLATYKRNQNPFWGPFWEKLHQIISMNNTWGGPGVRGYSGEFPDTVDQLNFKVNEISSPYPTFLARVHKHITEIILRPYRVQNSLFLVKNGLLWVH